ncbi:hypothetical protein HPP92_028368 [Vanilla planifolia]|uniref:Uncharacterized protein n=1 Tax=Vanilla planifolia TaxID=51239 RepID=A0A835P8X3_VANPL|nr:hypothetical protein HPP92_028368 [Vanilla planifolia]
MSGHKKKLEEEKTKGGKWLARIDHRVGWNIEDFFITKWKMREKRQVRSWILLFKVGACSSRHGDVESQLNLFHEPLGGNTFGDHSSASGSSHACPYLALHGFPHNMHAARSSSDTLQENSPFHQHSTSLTGHSSSERLNPQSFPATESQSHSWQPQPPAISMSLVGNSEQPSQYGLRSSRNDAGNQQRLGSFVQSHPFIHGSVAARSGSNNVLTGAMGLPVIGEVRAHARGHGSHMYQQSISSSSLRSSPFPHIRRSRPRGLTFISSSASNDVNGFYGFSVSSSTRNPQDSGRHFDRFFGWSREGFAPLPLVQLEGESQWWGPFNQAHSGSYLQRGGNAGDRVAQNRSENGYHQRMPPHNRMPPPPPPPYM